MNRRARRNTHAASRAKWRLPLRATGHWPNWPSAISTSTPSGIPAWKPNLRAGLPTGSDGEPSAGHALVD